MQKDKRYWIHERLHIVQTAVRFVHVNWSPFKLVYKNVMRDVSACKLCDYSFQENEMVHLAMTDKGNALICRICKDYAIREGVEHQTREKKK